MSIDPYLLASLSSVIVAAIAIGVSAFFSYKSIHESKKDRYINSLPLIKVVAMERRKNTRTPEELAADPHAQDPKSKKVIAEQQEQFYIEYENTSNTEAAAFIESVTIWVGSAHGGPYEKIELDDWIFMRILFSKEVDRVATSAPTLKDQWIISPQKVEIAYRDRWGHRVKCVAQKSSKLAPERLPFVGLYEYIIHEYEFDKDLV